MKLEDVLKSGKAFRLKGWSEFIGPSFMFERLFTIPEIISDEWELKKDTTWIIVSGFYRNHLIKAFKTKEDAEAEYNKMKIDWNTNNCEYVFACDLVEIELV